MREVFPLRRTTINESLAHSRTWPDVNRTSQVSQNICFSKKLCCPWPSSSMSVFSDAQREDELVLGHGGGLLSAAVPVLAQVRPSSTAEGWHEIN